jgi:AcrR family transcriptional regulator
MPPTVDPIANSVWAKPDRPRAGAPALGREQIVGAAIELLDAQGPDGLSMRRLGARLGSGATSLYWYVANKDELLDLAIDEIMGEVDLPDGSTVGWRAAAAALSRGFRSMILRHPWITGLFGVRPNIGPNAMRLSDRTLAVLTAAGFTGAAAAHAGSLLMSHAIGSATTEAAWRTALARSGMSPQDLEKSIEAFQDRIAPEYPAYDAWRRTIPALDMAKMQEDGYTFGLDRLLDGLDGWLSTSSARAQ